MTKLHSAVLALPLLFAAACMDMAEDGNAESDTLQASTGSGGGSPPTSEPIAPSAPRPPASSAPSVSPAVTFELVAPGGAYTCASGNLCVGAWDTTVSRWKVFKLFACRTYSVSQFNGWGVYLDNQTGNPTSVFYGQSHNPLFSFHPGGGQLNYNWDPIWFIKNC